MRIDGPCFPRKSGLFTKHPPEHLWPMNFPGTRLTAKRNHAPCGLLRPFAACAALLLASIMPADAARYRLVKVTDDNAGLNSFGVPVITSGGTIAFTASNGSNVNGVYTSGGSGYAVVRLANGNPFYQGFGPPSINGAGRILCRASTNPAGFTTGIYEINGATAATPLVPGQTAGLGSQFADAKINNNGDIAFLGNGSQGSGIFVISAGVYYQLTTTQAPSPYFNFSSSVNISDGGAVYFTAQENGVDGLQIFKAGPPVTNGPQLPMVSLVKSDSASIFSSFLTPSANGGGTVAFQGSLRAGGTGIYRVSAGSSPVLVVRTGSGTNEFGSLAGCSIGSSGKIVFYGGPNNAQDGIFDGPNPTTNKVVQRGDTIDGRSINNVNFSFNAVDGRGAVVFKYTAGSVDGIGLALPDGVVEPPPPPEGELTVASSSKTGVPGAGDVGSRWPDASTWESLGEPAIDDSGAIAFHGRIKLPPRTTGPRSGIFRQSGATATVVAAVGDDVGPIAGMEFSSFLDPLVASDGGLLFEATLRPEGKTAGTLKALFYQPSAGAPLQLVTQAGADVGGTGGAKIFSWKGIALEPGGKVGLLGRLKPGKTPKVTGANDDITAAWSPGGTLEAALFEGQALSGSFVKKFQLFLSGANSTGQGRGWFGLWSGETGGRMMAAVTLKNGQTVLGTIGAPANAWQPLVGTGIAGPGLPSLPAGTNFKTVALPSFAPEAKGVVFRATLSDRSTGIYRRNIGAPNSSVVALPAAPIAGVSGATVATLGDPISSPDGTEVLWTGLVSVPGTRAPKKVAAVQASSNGNLRIVAHVGASAPSAESRATWKSFQQIAVAPVPAGGGAIILGTMAGVSGKVDQALWMADATGTLRLLIREGQPFGNTTVKSFTTLRAVTGQFGVSRSYNSQGQIAVKLVTADGMQHVAVVATP